MFSLNQTCWGHQSFTYKPQPKAIELYSLWTAFIRAGLENACYQSGEHSISLYLN
jgi:hypothetical protein